MSHYYGNILLHNMDSVLISYFIQYKKEALVPLYGFAIKTGPTGHDITW